jgi:hypothetical protein
VERNTDQPRECDGEGVTLCLPLTNDEFPEFHHGLAVLAPRCEVEGGVGGKCLQEIGQESGSVLLLAFVEKELDVVHIDGGEVLVLEDTPECGQYHVVDSVAVVSLGVR